MFHGKLKHTHLVSLQISSHCFKQCLILLIVVSCVLFTDSHEHLCFFYSLMHGALLSTHNLVVIYFIRAGSSWRNNLFPKTSHFWQLYGHSNSLSPLPIFRLFVVVVAKDAFYWSTIQEWHLNTFLLVIFLNSFYIDRKKNWSPSSMLAFTWKRLSVFIVLLSGHAIRKFCHWRR